MRQNHPNKPSQRDIGDLLGITENNYRKLENNHIKTISLEAIEKLCNFFNCTPNDIFSLED